MAVYLSKYIHQSPVGNLEIVASDRYLVGVKFTDEPFDEEDNCQHHIIKKCVSQLDEYFSDGRSHFDLPLNPIGTAFQQKVWEELKGIPKGKTISYMELAEKLGDPKLIRAVGSANGKNPFHIVVPCHRVIGNNGDLVGYAGGLGKKRLLLELEGALFTAQLKLF